MEKFDLKHSLYFLFYFPPHHVKLQTVYNHYVKERNREGQDTPFQFNYIFFTYDTGRGNTKVIYKYNEGRC